MSPQKSKDLQCFIFSNLPVGVVVFAGADIIFANEKAAEMFGLSTAGMIGMTAADLDASVLNNNLPSAKQQSFGEIVASPNPLNNLERKIRSIGNGVETRVLLSTLPELSPQGDPCRVIVSYADISDRGYTEEVCYRGVFEHMTEGCAYCRMIFKNGQAVDWVYLAVNEAFSGLTGLTDVAGRRVSDVIPSLRESDPKLFEVYGRVALTGKPDKFEIQVQALDMWFSVSVFSPEREYFVAVFDVIDERKRIETEREQLLVDACRTNAILSADMDAMRWLQDLGAVFLKDGNLQEILAEVVDAAIDISGAEFGDIQLIDPATSRLKILAQHGFPPWWVDYWNNVGEGKDACGTALRLAERVIIEDIEQSSVVIGSPALDYHRRAGIRAVQSTPLFSRSGKLIGMLSTHYKTPHRFDDRTLQLIDLLARQAADIINQAQNQAAMKANQVRLGLALEAAHAGIWEWDLQGDADFWSDEVWSVYGIKPYSVKPSYQAWLQTIHPDDRDQAERNVRQAVESGSEINVEWRALQSSGTECWIMSRGQPVLDDRGRVVGYNGIIIDISERKCTEAELFASKAKMEAALASMTDAVFISDAQGRFIHFNEAFATFHKFKSKDECATTLEEYPAFLEVYKADGELAPLDQWAVPRALRGEAATNEEYMLRRKDTGESWVGSYSFAPIRDQGGAIVGSVVVGRDITASKEAEWEKLRRVKDRYRAIVMDQNDLICRFNPEGRITFVNDAYCRTFGVDYREILGTDFLPDIHQDDLEMVHKYFHDLNPMEPQKSIEYRVYLPGKKLRWQQWSGRALFNNVGSVIEYQAVGRDITERKLAEERLEAELELRQLFMDAFPGIALLIHQHSREVAAANKTAASRGAVVGRPCYTIWRQRDTPCPWCVAPRLWETGEPQSSRFCFDGIHWDAHWVLVDGDHLYLHYILDVSVEETAKLAMQQSHDYLENRVKERTLELEQSHAQLMHSEKLAAVGSLSASIAHEFNNPLQSVMTVLKGIGMYMALAEKEKKLVGMAYQECIRMKNLIADLRDFYRPTSDKVTSVDIHGILDGLLLISKKDLLTRNVRIEKRYADGLPWINGVTDQLKQVFLNLLNNASYACKSGGTITVETEVLTDRIAVRIKDTGTGIKKEDLPHIFEPFFTTKPELKGTGLGLSVSYGIIKKHGGHFEVESEPGKGSTFSVFLPLDQEIHDQKLDTLS